ncbi:MAG: F0F1 ATP synthase subunit B [Betaproteobacteria bacterium]|nr:F0F1 ATP synthase subunit B [Betaproteobacteria bacterium]
MSFNLTLLTQMLAFAAFILFTVKVVWPYLLRAIETRQKTIADGLAAAEQGRKSLEVSTRQSEETVRQGRERAAEVIAQAEKRAAQMIDEARTQAKEEGDREKTAARAEIEQQVARAKEALREQVATLAMAGAEKILRREVDAKTHADLLVRLKQELR